MRETGGAAMRGHTKEAPDLAAMMGEVARQLDQPDSVADQLSAVLNAAVETVPGVDVASITVLHKDGRAETVAWTDPLAYEIDVMQYELDEGPCLDALRRRPFLRVDDMPAERRWPVYAPKAAEVPASLPKLREVNAAAALPSPTLCGGAGACFAVGRPSAALI